MALPQAFAARMRALLGEEYPQLAHALEETAPVRAFRVNGMKISQDAFAALPSLSAAPIAHLPFAYDCTEERPGNHPYHAAGMIYVQDPSAMAVVGFLPIQSGERVLDVCASPGGKSSQLAEKVGECGVLVSNEYVPSRCKTLVGNIERLGAKNTIVTNTSAETLAAWYDRVFDWVLVDAPCSGEGMFRKHAQAVEEWSEENVRMCAERQKEILSYAHQTVRGGGHLVYATCTFSLEENEKIIDAFLTEHPEYTLEEAPDPVRANSTDGIVFAGAVCKHLDRCRRFYPHLQHGEGQFFAILRKREDEGRGEIRYRDASLPCTRKESAELLPNVQALLQAPLVGELRRHNQNFLLRPTDFPIPPAAVFSAFVLVGSMEKGNFLPHHQFFSAYGKDFVQTVALTTEDPRLAAYLRGETFPLPEDTRRGFAALLVHGVPLGGVKLVAGVAKNHYPKGLRLR